MKFKQNFVGKLREMCAEYIVSIDFMIIELKLTAYIAIWSYWLREQLAPSIFQHLQFTQILFKIFQLIIRFSCLIVSISQKSITFYSKPVDFIQIIIELLTNWFWLTFRPHLRFGSVQVRSYENRAHRFCGYFDICTPHRMHKNIKQSHWNQAIHLHSIVHRAHLSIYKLFVFSLYTLQNKQAIAVIWGDDCEISVKWIRTPTM